MAAHIKPPKVAASATEGISSNSHHVDEHVQDTTISVSNVDFINAVFRDIPDGIVSLACSKTGNPNQGGWRPFDANEVENNCKSLNNNYFNSSAFNRSDNGDLSAKKQNFAACFALVLDDVGTKVSADELSQFSFSWKLETSPGNYQFGLLFAEPVTDGKMADDILKAFADKGWCDAGATGPTSRWARLPVGVNEKPTHAVESGKPFICQLTEWHPEIRYTPDELIHKFGLILGAEQTTTVSTGDQPNALDMTGEVYFPVSTYNPVIEKLKEKGLYKTPLGSGKHDITCPWLEEHTDSIDHGTACFEPDDKYPSGGFSCMHSHGDKFSIKDLLNYLGIERNYVRHKPLIRAVEGEMHRVVDAAEMVLANGGNHYQSGGLIVRVHTDARTGNPETAPISLPALTKSLSTVASWEKFDKRSDDWVRRDPPARHCSILYDSKEYQHLPALNGVVRQPYLRESDGELIDEPGYNRESGLFGVFDAGKFSIPNIAAISDDQVKLAKGMIEDLLVEFSFTDNHDKAAAVSAIFTAVVRPTLPHAPAFHAKAPVFGSGKSFLCELTSIFAGPAGSLKVSYPRTADEATKSMLALLMTSPAVIEFDDMDCDWIPHGTINRMLTAEHITDRILGVSKTATVSTRSLILGSGNNVGPVRDLLRRVITINIDPRCATPATKIYSGNPVETVKSNRESYVSAVLTLILAWKAAGSPKADVAPIASYSGLWSDYCRHAVMWLGYPDPATSLIEQLKHDPDAENLFALMTAWHTCFGSNLTTVRKAVETVDKASSFDKASDSEQDLLDALTEFPVGSKGNLNRSKIGWILKKNADRIIDGYHFERGEADGRTAWNVVYEPTE